MSYYSLCPFITSDLCTILVIHLINVLQVTSRFNTHIFEKEHLEKQFGENWKVTQVNCQLQRTHFGNFNLFLELVGETRQVTQVNQL